MAPDAFLLGAGCAGLLANTPDGSPSFHSPPWGPSAKPARVLCSEHGSQLSTPARIPPYYTISVPFQNLQGPPRGGPFVLQSHLSSHNRPFSGALTCQAGSCLLAFALGVPPFPPTAWVLLCHWEEGLLRLSKPQPSHLLRGTRLDHLIQSDPSTASFSSLLSRLSPYCKLRSLTVN